MTILLWAVCDLTVPGLCSTEEENLPSVAVETIVVSATLQAADAQPHSQQAALENDCWCCCSHIAPTAQSQITVLTRTTLAQTPISENPSQGWLALPYHPPRA
jgi:hypothetical protein